MSDKVLLLADAGPLITLAYADALDLLFAPGWTVQLVDMVVNEVTRNQTPTSEKIALWINNEKIRVLESAIFQHYHKALASGETTPRKSNLGELAIQEVMQQLALRDPSLAAVFLFEDHKIARTTFVVPDNCRKISTRAFLIFLEQHQWIESASQVERRAIIAGREFSQLKFPESSD